MGAGLRYRLKSEYLSPLSDQAIPQARTLHCTVLMGSIHFVPYRELYVALIMTTTIRVLRLIRVHQTTAAFFLPFFRVHRR